MSTLALNLGKKSSWAVYNEKHSTKIVNGKFLYKKIKKKDTPKTKFSDPDFNNYKRFYNLLDDICYHHNDIDNISYLYFSEDEKNINHCYKQAITDYCNQNKITCNKIRKDDLLKNKQKDNLIQKAKEILNTEKVENYSIEDEIDALPVLMLK